MEDTEAMTEDMEEGEITMTLEIMVASSPAMGPWRETTLVAETQVHHMVVAMDPVEGAAAAAAAEEEEGAMALGDINYIMFWLQFLAGEARRWAKEMSGKPQVTLRQSSESIRGTLKSDITAAKSEKFMEEGLYTQDMSADDTPP